MWINREHVADTMMHACTTLTLLDRVNVSMLEKQKKVEMSSQLGFTEECPKFYPHP